MSRGLAAFALLLVLTAAGVDLPASPVSAADQSSGAERCAKAQASRSCVLYAPTATLGLPRSSFQSVPCGGARGSAISVDYGSQGSGDERWIGLQESPGTSGCRDGPNGLARVPVATFRVNGAKVSVAGRCPQSAEESGCRTSSPALLMTSGYTRVTLPGSASRRSAYSSMIWSRRPDRGGCQVSQAVGRAGSTVGVGPVQVVNDVGEKLCAVIRCGCDVSSVHINLVQ